MHDYPPAPDARAPDKARAQLRRWCGITAVASWGAIAVIAVAQADLRLRMKPELRFGVLAWLIACAIPTAALYWMVPTARNFLDLTRLALQKDAMTDEYIAAYRRLATAHRAVCALAGYIAALAYGFGALIDVALGTHTADLSGTSLDITMITLLAVGGFGTIVGITGSIMADIADIMELAAEKRAITPAARGANVLLFRRHRSRWDSMRPQEAASRREGA